MRIQLLPALTLLTGILILNSCSKDKESIATRADSKYISSIFEYMPAPGQLVNESPGSIEQAKKLIGGINGTLSLGAYGGYLVFGFDHAIENAEGADIGIYGNPIYSTGSEWSEPGIVMVMQDLNGNGLPDDGEWYELAGSEYNKPTTLKNYKITYYNPKNTTDDILWKDNQGKSGYVLRNNFHTKDYYPLFVSNQDSISFEGTLLANTLTAGGIITNKSFEWGYCDSGSPEFIELVQKEGRGYNTFDISWAVDKNGNKVNLEKVNFIKVYTGQNSNGTPFDTTDNSRSRFTGEISTEISGAFDMHY